MPTPTRVTTREAIPDRWQILVLLADLAAGHSYREVHGPIWDEPDFGGELARELEWVRAAHTAVADGFPIYLRLMQDPNPSVRAATAYVLAGLPERSAETCAALRTLVDHETNARAKGAMLLALSELAKDDADTFQRLQAALVLGESPFVRLMAAKALSRLAGSATPPEATEALVQAILDPGSVDEPYQEWPWDGDVLSDSTQALSNLGPTTGLPLLVGLLHRVSPDAALGVAYSPLEAAFSEWEKILPGTKGNPRLYGAACPVQKLDADQRRILEAIARTKHVWRGRSNMGNLLRSYGLPDRQSKLRSFLSGRPSRSS